MMRPLSRFMVSPCCQNCGTTTWRSSDAFMRPIPFARKYGDVASASVLENWIDEADQRVWFLFESRRRNS